MPDRACVSFVRQLAQQPCLLLQAQHARCCATDLSVIMQNSRRRKCQSAPVVRGASTTADGKGVCLYMRESRQSKSRTASKQDTTGNKEGKHAESVGSHGKQKRQQEDALICCPLLRMHPGASSNTARIGNYGITLCASTKLRLD